jgi:hypothetical protein
VREDGNDEPMIACAGGEIGHLRETCRMRRMGFLVHARRYVNYAGLSRVNMLTCEQRSGPVTGSFYST